MESSKEHSLRTWEPISGEYILFKSLFCSETLGARPIPPQDLGAAMGACPKSWAGAVPEPGVTQRGSVPGQGSACGTGVHGYTAQLDVLSSTNRFS